MRGLVGALAACVVVLALSPGLAFAQDAGADGPFGPFAGYSFDPLAVAEPEDVPVVQQPNYFQLPAFNTYFGSGMRPSGSGIESVAVGAGSDGTSRVYVASARTNRVQMFKGTTGLGVPNQALGSFGGGSGPAGLSDAAGISYWRGEVFVVDRSRSAPGQARVVIYDSEGTYRRQFPVINPLGVADITGVDVAAGEVWVTGELCGGFAGIVEIFDATTGAFKGIVGNAAHAPTGDPTHPCDASYDASSWWDLSVVPEFDAAVAQYRLVKRNLIAAFSVPDPEPSCLQCFRRLWQEGNDSVWGMSWFLAVDGYNQTARGTGITEFSFEPNQAGQPYLRERRRWAPKQAESGGVRDIAYLNRETRIDASGPLMGDKWLRANKCLDYVVSDADVYAVGDQGEHWLEPARNFERIELHIDGQLVETKTGPTAATGQFCRDTASHRNGQQRLELKAYVDGGRVVTTANDELRIDNALPEGALDDPGSAIRATKTIQGTLTDAHSGPRDWQLEVRKEGATSWQTPCPARSAPEATGNHSCDWNTHNGQYPDGRYTLRSRLRDLASDTEPLTPTPTTDDDGNTSNSPERTTLVDNTPPAATLSGDLPETSATGPLEHGQPEYLTIAATDSGSGVTSIEVLVDGVVEFTESTGCPGGGCGREVEWTLDPERYGEADHVVTVRIRDAAGHATTHAISVDIEANTPETPEEDAALGDGNPGTREAPQSSAPAATQSTNPFAPFNNNPAFNFETPDTGMLDSSILPCTAAGALPNFGVYTLGQSFEGLSRKAELRRCDLPFPGEPVRANFVSHIYGDCAYVEEDEGCAPPLEVQSWPACERSWADYSLGPAGEVPQGPMALAEEQLQRRGVPAAAFEDYLRLELYTGNSTVVIFGTNPGLVERAIAAVTPMANTVIPPPLGAKLPDPLPGAMKGTLPCVA